ncbi:MAG: hypothetical protein M1820_001747 [Bogoriella megaspora]|nr:MAG: hypothetical protein M1820_001747 [Bogoriella megaspora]
MTTLNSLQDLADEDTHDFLTLGFEPTSTARIIDLPTPKLELDFRLIVQLEPKISVGQTPFGHRNWIAFSSGQWVAKWGKGVVVPGGQDSQIVTPTLSTSVATNYLLQTSDDPPAYIAVQTSGWRTGPPEVLSKLFNPDEADKVSPYEYRFRISIRLETGDERLGGKLNEGMWIGSGARLGNEVVYDAYRIL